MGKEIILCNEKKKEIIDLFGYSRQTVWAALNFKTKSNKSRILRAAAIERGGVLIDGAKISNNATLSLEIKFFAKEQLFVQVFTDRVKVVADLVSGVVCIYLDNKVVDSYRNVQIQGIVDIQKKAQHIVNHL